jgi:GDP-4-dehydro-6-deoxy-D-mannose reductase
VQAISVKEDPTRLRPSDVPLLQGDASKIRKELGWQPEIPFEQTLLDTLEYWRRQIKAGKLQAESE